MSDSQFYGRFDNSTPKQDPVESRTGDTAYSIAKVFGYMFLFLLITTVVTFGLAFLFNYLLTNAASTDAKNGIFRAELVVAIASGIALIIMSIVTRVVLLKGQHAIMVPAVIYSILMGALMGVLSSLITEVYANGWFCIGISFGITTAIFGIMALIGLASKSKLNALPIIAGGLFMGALLISVVLLIMMLVPGLRQYYVWWYWILMFAIFAAVMLTTIWDIRNIKTFAQNGALTKNLSMYLAFNLYVDFIYILLRVLYFVLLIVGKTKK